MSCNASAPDLRLTPVAVVVAALWLAPELVVVAQRLAPELVVASLRLVAADAGDSRPAQ